jgi:hypothetical protein
MIIIMSKVVESIVKNDNGGAIAKISGAARMPDMAEIAPEAGNSTNNNSCPNPYIRVIIQIIEFIVMLILFLIIYGLNNSISVGNC